MNKQGTIALWSNASCIRSGGWWIESWRCLNSFDGKTCEAKQREEGQKLDPVELIRLIMCMHVTEGKVLLNSRLMLGFMEQDH